MRVCACVCACMYVVRCIIIGVGGCVLTGSHGVRETREPLVVCIFSDSGTTATSPVLMSVRVSIKLYLHTDSLLLVGVRTGKASGSLGDSAKRGFRVTPVCKDCTGGAGCRGSLDGAIALTLTHPPLL